ncbi:MAG: type II toxin-antitoxin system VapC family toxin [Rhizobiaceae bacterium]|nr:type II toxin-antitoxin system VapC family toxin [Rhizobiaceae bacterium]
MIFVVDTSVAIKWFVAERDTDRAQRLLRPDVVLTAPDLVIAEIANVLWRKQRAGAIEAAQVDQALQRLPDYFERLAPSSELILPALRIARDTAHSIYDCIYLAQAAGLQDAVLVTDDERFTAKVRPTAYAKFMQPLGTLSISKDD